MIYLEMSNSFIKEPHMCEGNFKSVKNDKESHGIGISQVKQAVDRYDGVVDFEVNNKVFNVNLMIYAKKIQDITS